MNTLIRFIIPDFAAHTIEYNTKEFKLYKVYY